MGAAVPLSSADCVQAQPPAMVASEEEVSLEEQVMDINSDALALLFEGNADHAEALFHKGISLVQSALSPGPPDENTMETASQALQVNLSTLELLSGVLDEPETEPLEHDSFLFYRHAFVLGIVEEENMMDTNDTQVFKLQDWDLSSLGALLLYNLGLIHHERGVNTRSPLAIRRARSLYYSALSLFWSGSWGSACCRPPQEHLVLALCTNLGHAATFFQDIATTQICHKRLEEVLEHQSLRWGLGKMQGESSMKHVAPPTWFHFFRHSWNRVLRQGSPNSSTAHY